MLYNLAKRIRNKKVLPYITEQDVHLDIGCGDGWLLRHSPADWKRALPRDAEYWLPGFDYRNYSVSFTKITLVAVMEHLDDPALVMRECCRLLAPGGQILITAPSFVGNLLSPLIRWQTIWEHKRVITFKYLRAITPPDYRITRKWFECGLNQLFIVEKQQ